MEIRAFFVSVFATRLDREDSKVLRTRVDGRNRLAELKARVDKNLKQGVARVAREFAGEVRGAVDVMPAGVTA